jgi:hypothetical protein
MAFIKMTKIHSLFVFSHLIIYLKKKKKKGDPWATRPTAERLVVTQCGSPVTRARSQSTRAGSQGDRAMGHQNHGKFTTRPTAGSGGDPAWISIFLKNKRKIFNVFLNFNLKLWINWAFYKSFRGIKIILSIFTYDLMPHSNVGGTLQQI